MNHHHVRKYELPYPAPFPSNWTRYRVPALTSRPFLTVDHKYAHLSPRLFPVQLAANLVHPPTPITNTTSSNTLTSAPTAPPTKSSSPPSHISIRNNLCFVPDSSSRAPLIAATPDASLEGLSIYQLDEDDEFVKNSMVRYARGNNNTFSGDTGHYTTWKRGDLITGNAGNAKGGTCVIPKYTKLSVVYGVQAVECDHDGGLILPMLADGVCIGRYNSGGKELVWVDSISIPSVRATDVNRVALTEFVALDNFSLRLYDISTATCTLAEDVQPIAPPFGYRWIQYSSHPRTVLVASKRNVCRFDLRCNINNTNTNYDESTMLVNPVDAWNLCPKVDRGISSFQNHPNNPFISVLTTGTILALMDHRMARIPLLEWNITFGNDISNVALMALDDIDSGCDSNDLAIALSANVTNDLALFHLTSDFKASTEEEILANPNNPLHSRRFHPDLNDNKNSNNDSDSEFDDDAPVLNHPYLLWSDMPLCHLEQFPAGNELRGVALVPQKIRRKNSNNNKKRDRTRKYVFSLVQASQRYGITAQRIGCEKFKDGTYVFEAPQDDGDKEGTDTNQNLLYGMDSAVDMLNARDALLVEAQGREAANQVIQQAVEPGLRMAKRLKCLDARDVLAVRNVLDSGKELDADRTVEQNDDEKNL